MGLINGLMNLLFGDSRNVLVETAQVFRPNAENSAMREADAKTQSLQQFAAEFAHARQGLFDRAVDALNRLPRPMLALGTIWLFVMAMLDPDSFAAGMTGLALVPEPLWWLMGAIVSFYFGARHQAKEQDFQRILAAATLTRAKPDPEPRPDANPALLDWQVSHGQ
ncbi:MULTISPECIES: holin family protein [unclassified Yoonia]|uniref:holin family protein n=1 Tax=unclassified Yoonia TaxID=2629118 RepID=UPI002B00270A|nr:MULTISPECIES: holin family protein [unclassified Yoonia]